MEGGVAYGELLQVVDMHLGFVCSGRDDIIAILGYSYAF